MPVISTTLNPSTPSSPTLPFIGSTTSTAVIAFHAPCPQIPEAAWLLEMGGKGNVQDIVQAVEEAMWEAGCRERLTGEGWYFPSIGEYTSAYWKHGGFEVQHGPALSKGKRS